ncbi:MAG: thiamine pyrophosphate-binding protein [Deltaproteobacteria bacterium]|nr:MAG: thiamine pyrophosphate-binding protein [Deltaproteobacteria bacterium]
MAVSHGGSIIAEVLSRHGVPFVYTLCGGHISPILTGAKARGIKVIDCRDERNAVFAADATARMTGRPGVAAVTAGPGVTNAMTALKNAQMAQTPMVLFGGATATVLRGRGSLQDIDQLSLMRPATKWATTVSKVADLGPTVEKAFEVATSGVPGPVFVEVPVDLLYPEEIVREWYLKEAGVENAKTLAQRALRLYLKGHLYRQFHVPHVGLDLPSLPVLDLPKRLVTDAQISKVADAVRKAKRPALVIGSQTMVNCSDAQPLADAVTTLGMPTWLGGTGRGLLGRKSDIQFRHKRGKALKEADLVIVAGFPFDFRMKYGLAISKKATVVAVNLNPEELRKNRKPEIAVNMNAGEFLAGLAREVGAPGQRWAEWFGTLRGREEARDAEIAGKAETGRDLVDPIHFFQRLEEKMSDDAVLVADGGDFVATAAYILRPRAPLSWLDPGVFGTLGVGGGFAVGASCVRPDSEVWVIWGDGSSAYSIAEFDTYARHGLAPIGVVGTDASWAQIARDQTVILGDDVGTGLLRTAYHDVAEGYGGKGLLLTDESKIDETLEEAKAISAEGKPVLINVHLAPSDFRKGSISI